MKNYYAGSTSPTAAQTVNVVEHGKTYPLKHIKLHSPSGYSWGYAGSGAADLALSILMHATGKRLLSDRLHQAFKFEFVSNMSEEWHLEIATVHDWIGGRVPVMVSTPHIVTGVAWCVSSDSDAKYGAVCTSMGQFAYQTSFFPQEESQDQYFRRILADWKRLTDGETTLEFDFEPYDGEVSLALQEDQTNEEEKS